MFENKICRLCLVQQPSVYVSIFENNITAMLEALISKKLKPTSDNSNVVCLKCLLNLKMSYNFQQKIKKCEEKFETLTNKSRIEPVTIQSESVVINEGEDVKSDKKSPDDVLKLYDNNCLICGLYVGDNLINDHIREHFNIQHKCELCNVTFCNIQTYRHHLLQHPETAVHQCNDCRAKFRYKSLYDIHINRICHKQEEIIQQRITTLALQSKKAVRILSDSQIKRKKSFALNEIEDESAKRKILKLGLRSSKSIKLLLGTEKKDYTCPICCKKFCSRKTFQAHTHKTQKCDICNRDVSKVTFKRHINDHTLGPQICHLCGATLQNKSSLVTHIFYSHNSLRYKCDECGKLFKKRNARDLHARKDHGGKPTHHCDSCGKGFYTARFLQKHVKMKHLKLRPHICEFCKRGFSSFYALKTHRRQHTNETPYKCEICGDGFRQNVSLKAHRKSRHNVIEPNTCDCNICGKQFASDVALHAHMRLH